MLFDPCFIRHIRLTLYKVTTKRQIPPYELSSSYKRLISLSRVVFFSFRFPRKEKKGNTHSHSHSLLPLPIPNPNTLTLSCPSNPWHPHHRWHSHSLLPLPIPNPTTTTPTASNPASTTIPKCQ